MSNGNPGDAEIREEMHDVDGERIGGERDEGGKFTTPTYDAGVGLFVDILSNTISFSEAFWRRAPAPLCIFSCTRRADNKLCVQHPLYQDRIAVDCAVIFIGFVHGCRLVCRGVVCSVDRI